jgi:hypothetical protein
MTDLDIYQPPAVEAYQARLAMTPEAAKALDDQLTQCINAILREGTDYGIIPGTGAEKSLWRPGAQKLLMWFGLGFTCDRTEIDTDDDGQRLGVTYRATITKRLPDGAVVLIATCEGYAGYDEAKFYKSAEQVQRDAEDKERRFAHADKRPPRPAKWQGLPEYRAPWNTVIKRAQKRAIVGATLDATAAGGRFNQDREEDDHAPAAEDGTTWYEQALEEALTFTSTAAGSKLFTAAAQAKRDGICAPSHADHVQNRIKQRLKLLAAATPVDAGDLGQPGSDASPAAAATPDAAPAVPDGTPASGPAAAAGEAPGDEPGEAAEPGSDRHRQLIGRVQGQFGRLLGRKVKDETDEQRAERLWMAAKLAGVSDIGSLSDLDTSELSQVANALAVCKDRQRLEELLANAGKDQAGE